MFFGDLQKDLHFRLLGEVSLDIIKNIRVQLQTQHYRES